MSSTDVKEGVYVLTIDHRHGTEVTAHRTLEGAEASLLEYVKEWWNESQGMFEEADKVDVPDDADRAIEAYFEFAGDEYYDIIPCEVGP